MGATAGHPIDACATAEWGDKTAVIPPKTVATRMASESERRSEAAQRQVDGFQGSIRGPSPSPASPALYLTLIAAFVGLLILGLSILGGAAWIIGGRMLQKRLFPMMQQVQRQIEAGMIQPAMASLRAMLPLGKWLPLLTGNVHAQIGILAHHSGRPEEAIDALEKAGRRSGDARLLLACIRYRDGKKDQAMQLLEETLPFNRKHVLVHNVYAWLLEKEGRRADAMRVLNRLLAKQPHEISSKNLLRLQNDQKLDMKAFGVQWFALGFERPPASMGEMRPIRKGFRTPPKQRGSKG
jgi:tetratricopeptide (TPR) repeat protein